MNRYCHTPRSWNFRSVLNFLCLDSWMRMASSIQHVRRYFKYLTWIKTYQVDVSQVNNRSDPECEEQWEMPGWSRLSLWLHIRTQEAVRGLCVTVCSAHCWNTSHHLLPPHTGHSSYLQITHPYIMLSTNHNIANHLPHFQPYHPVKSGNFIVKVTRSTNFQSGI